jgi:hypothetical protein
VWTDRRPGYGASIEPLVLLSSSNYSDASDADAVRCPLRRPVWSVGDRMPSTGPGPPAARAERHREETPGYCFERTSVHREPRLTVCVGGIERRDGQAR